MITEQKGFVVACTNPAKGSIEKCWFDSDEWTVDDAIEQYCTDYELNRSEVTIEGEDCVYRSEAVPVRLLMAVATPQTIVELSDGTYRWWNLDTRKPMTTGPSADWVKRGLTAHSVTWNGPSIQEMPMSAMLIRSSKAVTQ